MSSPAAVVAVAALIGMPRLWAHALLLSIDPLGAAPTPWGAALPPPSHRRRLGRRRERATCPTQLAAHLL